MRHLVGGLGLAFLAAACSGNGGGSPIFDPVDGQRDPATSGRDPTDTGDGVQQGAVSERPSAEASGGCFPCGKNYRCERGDDDVDIETDSRGGECVADGAVLACGGVITVGGQTVGSWSLSGSSLVVTTGGNTVSCTER